MLPAAAGCSGTPSPLIALDGGSPLSEPNENGSVPADSGDSTDASPSTSAPGSADAGKGAAQSLDATTLADATATPDGAAADAPVGVGDASDPCANQAVWITPMNAARAAVDAGEPPLVCDPLAVEVALNYAMQCTWEHNPNRNADYAALGGTGGLGENIAAGAPTQTIAAAVASWVNEEQFYDHTNNTCAANEECGHYTQIVWKTTTAVGCAQVHCTTGSPFPQSTGWDFSVCDYNPPGNVIINGVPQSPY